MNLYFYIRVILSSIFDDLSYRQLLINFAEENARQAPSVGKEMKFLKNFMTMNEEERKLIGHNFTSIFKACTFRGNDCLDEK